MKGKIKYKLTTKQIAAAISLLLGIILAIGYPTGSVTVKKNYSNKQIKSENVISKPGTKQSANTIKNIKKKVVKKRVIQSVETMQNNNDDEGC